MPDKPVPNDSVAEVPLTPAEIAAAAAARGLPIPPACAGGVAANLALLARHARVLRGEAPA